jgi:hypothetical protein
VARLPKLFAAQDGANPVLMLASKQSMEQRIGFQSLIEIPGDLSPRSTRNIPCLTDSNSSRQRPRTGSQF